MFSLLLVSSDLKSLWKVLNVFNLNVVMMCEMNYMMSNICSVCYSYLKIWNFFDKSWMFLTWMLSSYIVNPEHHSFDQKFRFHDAGRLDARVKNVLSSFFLLFFIIRCNSTSLINFKLHPKYFLSRFKCYDCN